MRRHLYRASSFGHKIQWLPSDVATRGKSDPRDGRGELAVGTGTGMGRTTETDTRTEMGAGTGIGRGKNEEESGGERGYAKLRSSITGGEEDARKGETQTSNQQPQPQDSTPQRNRRIVRRARTQGREAREMTVEDGGGAKKRKKPHKSDRCGVENWGELGGRRNKRRQKSVGSVDVDPGYQDTIRKQRGSARRSGLHEEL